MKNRVRFVSYLHKLVLDDGTTASFRFIALRLADNTLRFTNFHKYISNGISDIHSDPAQATAYVVMFLNYAFFEAGVKSLDELTPVVIKAFLNSYAQGTLESESNRKVTGRSKVTIKQVANFVRKFVENYADANKETSSINVNELFKKELRRNKRGQSYYATVPKFAVAVNGSKTSTVYRDMPNKAFNIIFKHIRLHHPELLMLVALSAFAGLRPSEACNVRRADSPLGAGMRWTYVNGKPIKCVIDLRHEYALRSDGVHVGGIKREREQVVPEMFIGALHDAYQEHLRNMDVHNIKCEAEFGPLSVNSRGMAITYASYYGKFREIINNELVPVFLADKDPAVVDFGRMLLERNLSPHVFRHWYTVQIVVGYDLSLKDIGELMLYRGDKNKDSCLTYIQNKGALRDQYTDVNNKNYEYNYWLAEKLYGGEESI